MRPRRPVALLALACVLLGLLAPAHGIAHRMADARLAALGGWCLPSGLPAPAGPAMPSDGDRDGCPACCASSTGAAAPPPAPLAVRAVVGTAEVVAAGPAPQAHARPTRRPTARAPPA